MLRKAFHRILTPYLFLVIFFVIFAAFSVKILSAESKSVTSESVASESEVPKLYNKLRSGELYVPVYSYIYAGDQLRPFNLAVTVSLRNTSSSTSMRIESATYYDSKGILINKIIQGPLKLNHLETFTYKIKESEVAGGSGGSIIVKFTAESPITRPILETISIGTAGGQGVSFTSRGELLEYKS